MTTARLSPAASLLRHSRLFALPTAVPLPPAKASSEPVFEVDTATTVYPTKAAIETPLWSLNKGDWGLKRALPLSSTTKSSTPVIRLRGGIDSAEHVADFESASEHVLTLQKWQELNIKILNRSKVGPSDRTVDRRQLSAFRSELDNTTSIPTAHVDSRAHLKSRVPSHLKQARDELVKDREAQAAVYGQRLPPPRTEPSVQPQHVKRWRYTGPWLAGMTDLEFDNYLKTISNQKKAQFMEHLKAKLRANKEFELKRKALEEGTSTDNPQTTIKITDQDVLAYVRRLRSSPKEFGPEIAAFFGLPEGPDRPSQFFSRVGDITNEWLYSRDTIASDIYKSVGPPRTHPSAGFSYTRSSQYSRNDPEIGPQNRSNPLPARILKDQTYNVSVERQVGKQVIGVAGIVARQDLTSLRTLEEDQWKPQPGGTKLVVKIADASIQSNGALEIGVERDREWELNADEVPFNKQESRQPPEPLMRARSRMEPLDGNGFGGRPRTSNASRAATKADEDTEEIFKALHNSFGGKR